MQSCSPPKKQCQSPSIPVNQSIPPIFQLRSTEIHPWKLNTPRPPQNNSPKNISTRRHQAARALPCWSRPKLLRGPAPPSSTSSAKTRRQGGKLSTRSSPSPGTGMERTPLFFWELTSRKCATWLSGLKMFQVLNPYFLVARPEYSNIIYLFTCEAGTLRWFSDQR